MIIKRDPDIIKCYFEDESGLLGGHADRLVLPESEKDSIETLKELSNNKIPATISGGGTGVTGSRVPFGGTIIGTDSLNKITCIDKADLTAIVQPGVRLSELENELFKIGLTYLPKPTESNAFIGGTVSTNASGARGFKYGSTRKYIKRLKVVLSSGDILDIKRGDYITTKRNTFSIRLKDKELKLPIPTYVMPNVKNASGYYVKDGMDLIDIFIGSEGTLGFIIEIEVSINRRLDKIMSFFSFFDKDSDALNFVNEAKRYSALSIEYMDENSLKLLNNKFPNILSTKSLVYFEQDYKEQDESKMIDQWIGLLEKHNYIEDKSYFADSIKEQEKLKEFRHALPETINEIVKKNRLPKVGTDIAVPDNKFIEMFDFYKERLSCCKIEYVIFGHIGESHMHVNLLPKNDMEFAESKSIYMDFVKKAVSLGGTVSAEHGIGKLKHKFLEAMYGKNALIEMARLKKALDPACMLGLGNIFPKELLASQ
ncbi:MAG: FAD-binding oxidoreductase [Candidatus Omnitrophota bacterium]